MLGKKNLTNEPIRVSSCSKISFKNRKVFMWRTGVDVSLSYPVTARSEKWSLSNLITAATVPSQGSLLRCGRGGGSGSSGLALFLSLPIRLEVEVDEKGKERGVERSIEEPAAHPLAPTPGEVVPEEDAGDEEAEDELRDLKLRDGPLPLRGPSPARATGKVVGVHDDVDGCVCDKGDRHQGLRGGEPDVAHDDDDGVVVDVEESETASLGEEDEECIGKLVELGEVKDVGPEEERTGSGGGGRGEAEEPAGGGEAGGGGEGAASGHGGGEEEEEEVVGEG